MKKIWGFLLAALVGVSTFCVRGNQPVSVGAEAVSDAAFDRSNFTDSSHYLSQSAPLTSERGLSFSGPATYQLPFTFSQGSDYKIKVKFSVDALAVGESAFLILQKNPNLLIGAGDYSNPGVYLRLTSTSDSAYRLDGFYSDGISYSAEALSLNWAYPTSVIRDHTFQIETSLIQGYTDGIRIFYNGVHFADWLCYSMVKNNVITDAGGKLYLSYIGKMTLTNLTPGDFLPPKITYRDPETPIYAGDEYVFGDISVDDAIDGKLSYETKLLDSESKNISDKLYKNADGKLCFKPLSPGEYTLRISASDYSYNAASKKVVFTAVRHDHYPVFDEAYSFSLAARASQKYYFPAVSAHDIDEGGDNAISYAYNARYYPDNSTLQREAEVKQDEQGYYFEPSNCSAYKTDGLGQYYLLITATNSFGSSYLEKDIWVKPDVVGDDATAPKNFFSALAWAPSDYVQATETSVKVAVSTYYKAGLDLDKGIVLTLKIDQLLDKGSHDQWFSLGFLKHPGYGKYGDNAAGLYYLFFYQDGAFRYDLQYTMEDGTHLDIKNNEAIYPETPSGDFVLTLAPFDTALDPSMDDNLTTAFDGSAVDSYEMFKVLRSSLSDDEHFVYLSYGYYNSAESSKLDNGAIVTNNPVVEFVGLRYVDKIAPVLSLKSAAPTSGVLGESIILPDCVAIDETDGNVTASLISVTGPDGVTLTIINQQMKFTQSGTYQVLYAASDKSGNTGTLSFEIVVPASGNSASLGWAIGASLGGAVFIGGVVALVLVLRKKRKKGLAA
jgi:hypothetical protein